MRNSKKKKQKRKESIAVCFFRHNKMWKILINSTGVPFVSGKKYKQLSSTFNNHCFIIRRKQWYPTPVLLPGKSQGWRILVDCSPWGRKESDTTERLHLPSFLVPQHTGDLDHGQIEAMLAKIPIHVLFRNTKRGLFY